MKLAILAGGYGTRISEESELKPKPMVEIGDYPILWHIMKYYSTFGINEFVILLGYKGYVIKEYFANYFLHNSDVTFDLKENSMSVHNSSSENWKVSLINTGLDTMTGGRLLRAKEHLKDDTFLLTYGDGLSDVDIEKLISSHKKNNKTMTLTAVQPEGRFGALEIDDNNRINQFLEKPKGDGSWINGGFFVCNPEIFEYIQEGDKTVLERSPLETLTKDQKLFAYKHHGFWQPMDTLRDKIKLNNIWQAGNAPWKIWQ